MVLFSIYLTLVRVFVWTPLPFVIVHVVLENFWGKNMANYTHKLFLNSNTLRAFSSFFLASPKEEIYFGLWAFEFVWCLEILDLFSKERTCLWN